MDALESMRPLLRAFLLILALVPSAWMAYRFSDMPHFGRFDDDGVYVVCAKSLAAGEGYRIASLPSAPYETKYPPLFSFLLAGIWKIAPGFPGNLRWIVLLVWLSLGATVVASFAWFRRLGFGDYTAMIMAALVGITPVGVFFGISAMSELLFTALLIACLAVLERDSFSTRIVIAAGLLASVAYLCRTAALPLLITVPLCLVVRKNWRAAATFAVTMLPAVGAWTWWSAAHRVATTDTTLMFHTDYFGQQMYGLRWADLPGIIICNGQLLVASIGRLPVFGTADTDATSYWVSLVGMVLVCSAVAALWRERGQLPFGLTFAVAYCGILLLWWTPPNERFVLPIYPILLAALVRAFLQFVERLRIQAPRAARVLPVCVVVALLAVNLFGSLHEIPRIIVAESRSVPERRHAYEWIVKNTPEDARLFAYFDTESYLYTGRKATQLHLLGHPSHANIPARITELEHIPDFARHRDLSFALLTSVDFLRDMPPPAAETVLSSLTHDAALQSVYRSQSVGVYRIRPEDARETSRLH